jgi:hypothetical protein
MRHFFIAQWSIGRDAQLLDRHFEGHLPLPVGERVADQKHSGVFVGLDMVVASVRGRAIHGDGEATIGPENLHIDYLPV